MDAAGAPSWIVSTAISAVGVLLFYLWRQLDSVKTKDNERRLNELAVALTLVTQEKTALSERLRLNDLETVRLQGEIALIKAGHSERDKDIDGVRDQLRQQIEILRKVEGRVNEIAGYTIGRQSPGRYPSPSPGSGSSDPRLPSTRSERDR